MLRTLFSVANLAMIAWVPLWFLPRWRFTRWLAEQTVAPFVVALLWLVGFVPIVAHLGLLNVLRDFGSADGVLHLFAGPDFALLIWIQILAWDLFVGLYIYRDNMAGGYLPLSLQSVLLFITFWVGPVGFLLYYVLRAIRRSMLRRRAAAREHPATAPAPATPPVPAILFHGERLLLLVGLLGLVVTGGMALVMAGHGRYIAPEGDLTKPLTFCLAVGLYLLSLAAFLPLAGFTARGRSAFRWTMAVTALYSYFAEVAPTLVGFDPRFSHAASIPWRIFSGLFGLASVFLVGLILTFTWRVFRFRTPPARPLLVLGLRYGLAAGLLAVAGGIWMIAIQGRYTGVAGNILFVHAVGFHGIQAVPLVAWLLEKTQAPAVARRWVHAGGGAYLGVTVLLLVQTMAGRGLLDLTPMSAGYAVLLLVWAVLLALAAIQWWRVGVGRRPAGQVRA